MPRIMEAWRLMCGVFGIYAPAASPTATSPG